MSSSDPPLPIWLTPRLGCTSPDPEIAHALHTVFPHAPVAPEAEAAQILTLTRDSDATDILCAEGIPWRRFRNAELVAVLESALTELLVQATPTWFFLHAALLRRPDGTAVLFAADRGHGKSTLSVELPRDHGWSYGGDDLAAYDPATGCWHPLPKAACLKAGSLARFPDLEQHTDPLRGPVGLTLPDPILAEPVQMADLAAVVFPDFSSDPKRASGLEPMLPHTMALALIQQTCGGLERHPDSLAVIERLCHLPGYRLQHDSTTTAARLLGDMAEGGTA